MRAILFGLRGIVGTGLAITLVTALGATLGLLIAGGIARHRLAPVPDANAGECCVYPGRDQKCVPCRPTRGAQ